MAEQETRVARAVSTSPDGLLAAPSEYPFNNSRHRSTSLAPSLRSTKSNVTIVEDKENRTSVAKTQVLRQQTFKIQRKFDLIDRIKALWDPKGLIRKMETSIECVPPNALDEDMLNQTESPFIVDVHVSPKLDSTKYHKLRCLLDTGCLQGNIVSQEIVDSLGFTKADYEPLSWKEKQGGQSVTGELLTVDAAILLSWHHNTSPHRYRQMRFLISPCTKVDMIIGTRSIIKHNLMAPPVFMVSANAGKRALNTLQSDATWRKLKAEYTGYWTKQKKYQDAIKAEEEKAVEKQDAKKLKDLKAKKVEYTHKTHVSEMYVDAREAELKQNFKEAERLHALAKEEEQEWAKNHPAPKPKTNASGSQSGHQTGHSRIKPSGPQSLEA